MLHRARSSPVLLRLAGIVLLYGLFWVVRALFAQGDVGRVVYDHEPMLFWDARASVDNRFFGYPFLANSLLGTWFDGVVLPGPLLYTSQELFPIPRRRSAGHPGPGSTGAGWLAETLPAAHHSPA